jgi:hypothetical protein
MNMRLIKTDFGYNYWKGEDGGKPVYNVVPQNQPAPSGGYLNADYICKVKGVPNMFNQSDTQQLDETFRKEMLASEKMRNNTHTRILYGHLTEEDLWYGASTGLEGLNPLTGNWVTIWDISQ